MLNTTLSLEFKYVVSTIFAAIVTSLDGNAAAKRDRERASLGQFVDQRHS